MLNVDGVNSDGVVSIQPDATISVLSLGSIKTADIEGSIDHLIVVGKSDAVAPQRRARIGRATLGDSCADLVINANSSVGDVDTPFEAQVSGEGSRRRARDHHQRRRGRRAAPRHAARGRERRCRLGRRHRRPDRRRNRPAGESARRQRHRLRNRRLHQPFAPQTAYADETAGGPTIDTEDAADDDNDENLLSFTPGEPLENDGEP